MNVIKLGK